MIRKIYFTACPFLSFACYAQVDTGKLPFWNYKLSFEERANDFVSRLTLEENVVQMLNHAPAIPRLGIPAYGWWNEVLHSVAGTPFQTIVYPKAIAMTARWDTTLYISCKDKQIKVPEKAKDFQRRISLKADES